MKAEPFNNQKEFKLVLNTTEVRTLMAVFNHSREHEDFQLSTLRENLIEKLADQLAEQVKEQSDD